MAIILKQELTIFGGKYYAKAFSSIYMHNSKSLNIDEQPFCANFGAGLHLKQVF